MLKFKRPRVGSVGLIGIIPVRFAPNVTTRGITDSLQTGSGIAQLTGVGKKVSDFSKKNGATP